MKKYFSFFRLRFTLGLQYRVAALAGIATQFAWGFMEVMIFAAFYRGDKNAFPMSLSATCSYIWLGQGFLAFFATWMMDNEIFDSILKGNIAYELCRPIDIYNIWFSKSVAVRLSRAMLRCFPILLVAAFLPDPYGLAKPESCLHFCLFILTLVLGLLVTAAFCMLIYILTFYTISPQGLRILFTSAADFFSGGVIPLPFFPEPLQNVIELLPFASMQNVSLRIYSGSMGPDKMEKAILLQLFWLVTLIFTGKMLCRRAEKKITVQGG